MLPLVILLALLFMTAGGHVFITLLLIPFLFLLIEPQAPLLLLPQKFFGAIDSFPLMAVPFFILVGQVMNQGGITDRIFSFANSLIGHVRGGLAQVNILASLLLAGMSGSSVADAAGIGRIEIEAMRKNGYTAGFAAAVTAASSTIGGIFPPSISLVIIGAITGTSISQLLLAGLIPGLLMTFAMFALVTWIARSRSFPSHPRSSVQKIAKDFISAVPALLAPAILLGGILSGIFTPTEASAVAAAYSIFVARFIYREIDMRGLIKAFVDTAIAVSAIFLLIGAAGTLSWLMTWINIPQQLAMSLGEAGMSPSLLLLASMVLLVALGLFLESNAALILVAPILFPIITSAGVDPVQYGVVVVFALAIGLITPPFGMCMFITMSIANISMGEFLREIRGFIIILLLTLLALAYFPILSLALPTYFFR